MRGALGAPVRAVGDQPGRRHLAVPQHGVRDEHSDRLVGDVLRASLAAAAAPAAAESAAVTTAAVAASAAVTTDAAVRTGAAVRVVHQWRRHWPRWLCGYYRAARSSLLFDLDAGHVHLGVRGGPRRAGG